MTTLRLGFIGLGQATNLILRRKYEFEQLPFTIAAATDVREFALDKFREEFNAKTFRTVEELCSSSDVDVVYIATPPEMHKEHAIIAAKHGKHMIVEKPLALSIEDCDAMTEAANKYGVKLLAGHTHSFDAPIRKMSEIIQGGELGKVVMINTWNINDFNIRPWPTRELEYSHGPVLNQGPHQVDIVRQLAGGMVKSVRASTIWDPTRNVIGGYSTFLQFEDGTPATLVYDARGLFDTAELFWWVGEGGQTRDPDVNYYMRDNFNRTAALGKDKMEEVLEAQKEQGRYGAGEVSPEIWKMWGYGQPNEEMNQPFFGLTLVSCEKGTLRQSPKGIYIYGEHKKDEVLLEKGLKGRAAELMELYDGVTKDRPIFHDSRWATATLEVCLAILQSAKENKEITMTHQVPVSHELV